LLDAERALGYPAGRLFIDGIETAIASLLVRHYGTFPLQLPANKRGMSRNRLRQVLEFMHTKLESQVTLKDIARSAGLSPSHFSAQFHASTGVTPHQYMLRLRIDRTKRLLKDSNLSILDIGIAAGFENQQHFATVFRRLTGSSPSTYRRIS
jgi:AraC family transcriptional regulator